MNKKTYRIGEKCGVSNISGKNLYFVGSISSISFIDFAKQYTISKKSLYMSKRKKFVVNIPNLSVTTKGEVHQNGESLNIRVANVPPVPFGSNPLNWESWAYSISKKISRRGFVYCNKVYKDYVF